MSVRVYEMWAGGKVACVACSFEQQPAGPPQVHPAECCQGHGNLRLTDQTGQIAMVQLMGPVIYVVVVISVTAGDRTNFVLLLKSPDDGMLHIG